MPSEASGLPPLRAPHSARSSSAARKDQSSYGSVLIGAVPQQYFPKDFWLSPRTCLTPSTPINAINRFCNDHGFRIWGPTPTKQRLSLYSMLVSHNWPEGYDGLMRALHKPTGLQGQQPESADFQTPHHPRPAFQGAEGMPDASVDQLIQVIRQQTEMTQRFQDLLGESRGLTKGREDSSDATMQLIREHTEKTSSLLQVGRTSSPPPALSA